MIALGGIGVSTRAEVETNAVYGPIDRFVHAKAVERGLELSPAAEPQALLRRLAYDLSGLPPQENWLESLSSGDNEVFIDGIVERLLNAPTFGEHLASMWMNVARYAEDQAHQVGTDMKHFYPNAYLYRRWVVDAFNKDLPYDRFIKLQLAADLYEESGKEDLPALGFLGLGPKYYNRGRLDVKAAEWEDRVDTVTRGFLGLTVACARCHDHKFDPISTEDYYGLAGVFASTKMVNAPYGKDPDDWTEEEKKQARYTVHIVEEGEPHDLPVFIRGNVERKGEIVPRRFPSLFFEEGEEPVRFTEGSGRKELAEMIATAENPLTAKVFVNRIWQVFFGRGIVGTASNFGALGDEPTHPELLNYLASEFVAHDWSTKWLVREIVASATYRQATDVNPTNRVIDPDNLYLWRMSRRRLSVEMWRDSVLQFAGNLNREDGGRSQKLDDPMNHRRTLYGRVSRLKLNPLLMNYDYPDPNVHSSKRAVTTTPLQKLYAMNSDFILGQARDLAERLRAETESPDEWVRRAYRLLFFREPNQEENLLAQRFLGDEGDIESEVMYAQALLTSNELSYLD